MRSSPLPLWALRHVSIRWKGSHGLLPLHEVCLSLPSFSSKDYCFTLNELDIKTSFSLHFFSSPFCCCHVHHKKQTQHCLVIYEHIKLHRWRFFPIWQSKRCINYLLSPNFTAVYCTNLRSVVCFASSRIPLHYNTLVAPEQGRGYDV